MKRQNKFVAVFVNGHGVIFQFRNFLQYNQYEEKTKYYKSKPRKMAYFAS